MKNAGARWLTTVTQSAQHTHSDGQTERNAWQIVQHKRPDGIRKRIRRPPGATNKAKTIIPGQGQRGVLQTIRASMPPSSAPIMTERQPQTIDQGPTNSTQ